MGRLDGRNALVTGSSRGIGAAIAKRLAAEGAAVIVNYAGSKDRADAVVKDITDAGGTAYAVQADVSREADVERMFAAVDDHLGGKLDILVNNAGVYVLAKVDEADVAHFQKTLHLNVLGPILVALQAVKRMPDGGRIINIGSTLGERVPFPAHSAYAMSKSAVQGLTRGWARDLGPRGITVNCLQPGPIDTEMNPDHDDNPGAAPQKEMSALGRYGSADEVASAVAYLASPAAAFITGGTLNVDGGIFV